MVNGKPNLTFGGTTAAASAAARQRADRAGKGAGAAFASYLPGAEAAARGEQAAPASPGARAAGGRGAAKMYLGFLPDKYISDSVKGYGADAATLASGGASRAEARSRPATAVQEAASRQSLMQGGGAAQAGRLSGKRAPVISGRPVTGRGAFGMADTRKTVAGRSTLAGRGGLDYASPNANAARAGALGMGQGEGRGQAPAAGAFAAPGSDAFSRFSAYYGGAGAQHGPDSFIASGFGGKNAILAMKKLGYDVNEARSDVTTKARLLAPDPYALQTVRAAAPGATFGSTRPVARASGDEGARTAVLTASHRRKNDALPTGAYSGRSLVPAFHAMGNQSLGSLAAKFESGDEGIAAIGYDGKGGTSYGKYQIASRVGTMKGFLSYLRDKAPDLASRLESAGPANTGGRGGRMPAAWRAIAAEDPVRFEALQSDFIRTSHFEPAMQAITAATGVSFDALPAALQEVLFSTSVQHGPTGATRIVTQALQRVDAGKLGQGKTGGRKAEEQLITHIYNLRAGQFVSSTPRVRNAVRNRLRQEMREALDMLS